MASVLSRDPGIPNGKLDEGSAAAADPSKMSSTDKQAISGVVANDEAKGAAVHAFNPDADSMDKAALAGKAKAQLAALPSLNTNKKKGDAGLALSVDTSQGDGPKPTVTVSDGDLASREEGQIAGADQMPGSIPAGAAPSVPTWMKTGWRQVGGLEITPAEIKKQLESNILTEYLSETMYGSWYHNAGIILFAVIATRFLTVLGVGYSWNFIILAFCASYYSLSITRTRQHSRDDIQRELVKTRLVTETESADWLNQFLDRFWLIYEPVLSQIIVASVDAVLATSVPSFLEGMKLTTFTLGTKAPRIDYVRTFPNTPEDVVIMDWAVSFTPIDTMDITPRQAQKQVNPKIVLKVTKGMPILLEDIQFKGKMRIKLQLITNFPHIKRVEFSFLEEPYFDYVLKPIGGNLLGFDINFIPGLSSFIRQQVHANLRPLMYDPNVFPIDLEALFSGTPLDSAIGVLKVTVNDARGLKAVKFGGGDPDPYVSMALGGKPIVDKTKVVHSTNNPSWHQTHFILINNLAEALNLGIWDYNDHRPDDQLGTVTQELNILSEDAVREGLKGKIIRGGKDSGELRYDLSFYPVLQPAKLPDGTIEPLPDTATGIVRLYIHQAKDLDISNERKDIHAFVKVYLGASREPFFKTPIIKHQREPIWEAHTEFLVPDKHKSSVTFVVEDNKEFGDKSLGNATIKLQDLLTLNDRGQDWINLSKSRAGKIRVRAEWKPVAMSGSLSGAAAYVPPIGILRVLLKNAIDVKNVEGTLGGKSDPYIRVLANNKTLARTAVQNNNLNPVWDEIVYVPVHNLRENIILELMDYQNIGKDRTLGYVELSVNDCAQINNGDESNKYPFVSKGHQVKNEKIKLDKNNSYKGNLLFEVDFKPAVSLKGGVSFEEQKNELQTIAEETRNNGNGSVNGSDRGPMSASTLARSGSIKTLESKKSVLPTPVTTTTPLSAASNDVALNGSGAAVVANNAISGHASKPSLSGTIGSPHESKGGGEATAAEDSEKGVSMTAEELLSSPSGVMVLQLISGDMAKKGYVEVLADEAFWPVFASTKATSRNQKWDQIGEGFVRELEFGRIWIRINANDESDKEDIVAEFKCDTKDFLEACLRGPADILLTDAEGNNRSTLKFSARYVPVAIKLEPRESMNNMGMLHVSGIRANNLYAVDRGGTSDPNVSFYLDGMRVFKSETIKKDLNPVWPGAFDLMIPSRVGADFTFEVNDWDMVGTADPLGGGRVDLTRLEPFEHTEVTLPVMLGKKGQHGTITFTMIFQPEIIARTKQRTSTFTTAGRAITQVGGLPIAAGKGVLGVGMGVGKGVGTIGGFAGRKVGLIKKKDKSGKTILVNDPDINTSQESGFDLGTDPSRAGTNTVPLDGQDPDAGRSMLGVNGGSGAGVGVAPSDPGVLNVTVLSGKDLKTEEGAKVKSYVSVKVGEKSHKTDHVKGLEPVWEENLKFNVNPASTSSLSVALHEHHSFGKDVLLGEAELNLWSHINETTRSAEVSINLVNGSGVIRLRLDWTAGAPSALQRNKSFSSLAPKDGAVTGSPGGGSSRLGGLRMSLSRNHNKDKETDGAEKRESSEISR